MKRYLNYILLISISTEAPNNILIQKIGDASTDIIAAAGEDLELECIATGANPPAKLMWYMDDEMISSGHSQEDTRQENSNNQQRTWSSISRLTLPVSKDDNDAQISCVATHPALEDDESLSTLKPLTIHCKSDF